MQPRPDAALKARAAAAHEVLRESPGVDGLELLAAVVWPVRPELAQAELPGAASRRRAEQERISELAAAGLNPCQIARQLGRPRSTVAEALRCCRALVDDQAA